MTKKPKRYCRICGAPEKLYVFGYSNLTPYSQICTECLNRETKKGASPKAPFVKNKRND